MTEMVLLASVNPDLKLVGYLLFGHKLPRALVKEHLFSILARGCPTEWLSGSSGTGKTLSHYRTFSGKSRLRGAAEPLSAGIDPDGGPSFMPQETADKKLFLSSRC